MEDPLVLLVVAGAALLGFTVAGVAGIGGGIITLPALIWAIGARDAITALAFTQILAAFGRMYFNWRDISWPVARWFCLGAIPAVVAGSLVFIATPSEILPRLLGGIILLVVLFHHTPWRKRRGMRLRWFAPVGSVTGFLAGMVGAVGPLLAPFYLGHGLVTGAFIGTSSFNVIVIQVPRLAVYGADGLLTLRTLIIGVAIGLIAFVGAYLGSLILRRVSVGAFPVIVEVVLIGTGVLLIVRG